MLILSYRESYLIFLVWVTRNQKDMHYQFDNLILFINTVTTALVSNAAFFKLLLFAHKKF